MVDRSTKILILLFPIALAACAYLIAWHGKTLSIRRIASLIVACLLAFFGSIGTWRYAIPALDDFHSSGVPLSLAIVANIVFWTISIGAWVIAVRCLRFAMRKNSSSRSS
jgi:hypothetical protein